MFKNLRRASSEIPEYFSLAIKIILALSILNAIYFKLWHVMSANIFLLVILLMPQIIKRSYNLKLPKKFEILLLFFVIFTFFVGAIKVTLAPLAFGIATSMIGFIILLILYTNNQIKKNYFLIILFSFNFAVSFGFGLEFIKYWLKFLLGHELSAGIYAHSIKNMTYVIIGATISSIIGYIYMKSKKGILRRIVERFIRENPSLRGKETIGEIVEMIEEGENEKLEFKSTLRTNLFTNEPDKKVEYSVLKTLVAFLNSQGGTLLIGVSDEGKITGIKKDNFPSKDKYSLHLTNIIKEKIGKEYLRLIELEFIGEKEMQILKIECKKSNKPVFLKEDKQEKFYIRTGPSSSQISGRDLIEYIENRFEK